MKKNIKQLKRYISQRVPEKIKRPARRIIRKLSNKSNPSIPSEELEIFTRLKNKLSIVFDVGAREDIAFYEIHPKCEYHLFEPNIKAVEVLQKKVLRLPEANIVVNAFGLSDINADNCIYYEDSQSFAINPFHTDVDTGVRYSLRRLDDYTTLHNISYIDFLKIDTEGFDYNVIKGGLKTIKSNVSYIQFEFWDNVHKFKDILEDTFDLYLLMEPKLLDGIRNDIWYLMNEEMQSVTWNTSVIPLTKIVIDCIDTVLAPNGWGCNFLGIKKNLDISVDILTFPIS